MKRAGNLFESILDRDNLRLAVSRAMRGKRDRAETRSFTRNLESNLVSLQRDLRDGSLSLGVFHQFVIHDPKKRIITAPCFRERILHHAIMNVCEPVFERTVIDDTFACRHGRGRLAALQRAQKFAGTHDYFLKLDIRKYFDSVPHGRLVRLLDSRIKDPRVLDLFERIIGSFRGSLGRGLPIGSLTSQHLANLYLGKFDRFVKETWRTKGYVRYMDDMLIWCNDKRKLREVLQSAVNFLSEELSLQPKPEPYINRSAHGVDFLGCRVFPTRLTLNRRSRKRYRRKLTDAECAEASDEISELELQSRVTALTDFTRAGGVSSWDFRSRVLAERNGEWS